MNKKLFNAVNNKCRNNYKYHNHSNTNNNNNEYMKNLFQYDLNEFSKQHTNNKIKDKVERQQRLIKSASSKLLQLKNNEKDKLIDKMMNSKSSFENQTHRDERMYQFYEKRKPFLNGRKNSAGNLIPTPKPAPFVENRKRVNDFYLMNDKYIKQKNEFILNTVNNNSNWKRPANFLELYRKNSRNIVNDNKPLCKKYNSSLNNY